MEHSKTASAMRWTAAGCAAMLTGLRILIIQTSFDENGLLPRGSHALTVTVLAAVSAFVCLWLLSMRLSRDPGTETCFASSPEWMAVRLAAAILIFFGSVCILLEGRDTLEQVDQLTAFGGILSALLLGAVAVLVRRGNGTFWLRLVPAVFTVAALILRFRTWSHDPLVIHIAPVLLAWTCCMVEMMLLSGFSLRAGRRRSGALFGLSAGVFTCMVVPDYVLGVRNGLPDLLTLLGLALWCAAAGLELLRAPEQPKAPEPEVQ